jgi:class 3 adenylate cyclase
MSDPIIDWSVPVVEQWADDLAAVVAVAELDRPVVVSLGDYWGPARLVAAAHPEALCALVLYEPHGPVEAVDLRGGLQDGILDDRVETDWIGHIAPSRADDEAFRQWFDSAGRSGASPAVAARLYDRPDDACVARLVDAQGRITVPTLVVRRPGNLVGSPPSPDPVVVAIPQAQAAELPGTDFHWLGEDVDSLLAAISRFVTGETRVPAPERALCAVLFTDIVGSTERARELGDARWKVLLDRHDDSVREEVERCGGVVVKTTGDGVLATFASAGRAVDAAVAMRRRVREIGLGVRIGIHVGDVERRGDDVSGIAVHVAARVMSRAGDGEICATAPVPLAVMGTRHRFTSCGTHALKGVPGELELMTYSSDGTDA